MAAPPHIEISVPQVVHRFWAVVQPWWDFDAGILGRQVSLLGVLDGSVEVGSAVAINDAVWSKLTRDWDNLRVVPEEFIAAGNTVVVLGRYVGTQARSGAELDAQVVHLWDVVDGNITRYRGFADTYALHDALTGITHS